MKRYHYIYAHYEKDTGELFYIGIGTWTEKTKETRNKLRIANTGHVPTKATRAKLALVNNKPVINCRGDSFPSASEAARIIRIIGLKGPHHIGQNISGKRKSAGKYPDGTKITWKYYTSS